MLIETRGFLMSAGTERMLVEFGKTGYLSKARSQPDKVKQVGVLSRFIFPMKSRSNFPVKKLGLAFI